MDNYDEYDGYEQHATSGGQTELRKRRKVKTKAKRNHKNCGCK